MLEPHEAVGIGIAYFSRRQQKIPKGIFQWEHGETPNLGDVRLALC